MERVDPMILSNLSEDAKKSFERNTNSAVRLHVERQLEVTPPENPSEETVKAVCELAKLLNKQPST
jgi:hypothetical protein